MLTLLGQIESHRSYRRASGSISRGSTATISGRYSTKCESRRWPGLRELAEPRRHAALVCFLWQSYRDAVDQAVDMFDKLLIRAHTQAQNELDEQLSPSAPNHPGLTGGLEVA